MILFYRPFRNALFRIEYESDVSIASNICALKIAGTVIVFSEHSTLAITASTPNYKLNDIDILIWLDQSYCRASRVLAIVIHHYPNHWPTTNCWLCVYSLHIFHITRRDLLVSQPHPLATEHHKTRRSFLHSQHYPSYASHGGMFTT